MSNKFTMFQNFQIRFIPIAVIALVGLTISTVPISAQADYDLQLLGSLRLNNQTDAQNTTYYLSLGTFFFGLTWDEAAVACSTYLNGSLVSIESQPELEGLTQLLRDFTDSPISDVDFWTSGKYEASSTSYKWSTNGATFPPWAPWGSGEPFPISAERPVGVRLQSGSIALKIPTARQKFICEVSAPDTVVPCYTSNDLLLLLDSSGSVGAGNYGIVKTFVSQLASGFIQHPPSRLGFTIYSNNVQNIFLLNNNLTSDALLAAILAAPYHNSGTPTGPAIDSARSQFAQLGRPGFPQSLVILTDGQSDSPGATRVAAAAARDAGIELYAVGITPSVDMTELEDIVGGDASRIYTAANWNELINLLTPLSIGICPEN